MGNGVALAIVGFVIDHKKFVSEFTDFNTTVRMLMAPAVNNVHTPLICCFGFAGSESLQRTRYRLRRSFSRVLHRSGGRQVYQQDHSRCLQLFIVFTWDRLAAHLSLCRILCLERAFTGGAGLAFNPTGAGQGRGQ